ncbi:retrovirus-related pol polyprotein from transposon TNT 1-94 [Tanacetum coccineum]|uniref:Retrovirus-related pol polyprotein from transposon TNT 1-94 n=1 Tax=Tanacetum coccineum TaxID=301880 RepID=A0ABQ5EDP4_9ASTR
MAAVNDVPQLVDKKGGSYAAIAPKLEPGKFNKWKKRMLCYLAGMEPYYLKCIKDGPFQPKTAEGDAKPESQWTPDERRVVVQDQRLKSIIMSCLPDDIMESVISCVSAKETWTDLVHSFEGPSDTKENRIMDLKLEYQTFRAKSTESLSQTYTRYKTLLNELANDGVNLSKHEINVGFVNSLPEKWLTFSQGLRNGNHTQNLDLAILWIISRDLDIESSSKSPFGKLKTVLLKEESISQVKGNENIDVTICGTTKAEYKKMKAKLALIEASPSSSENPKSFQPKNKGLVAETFDWDEEEVMRKKSLKSRTQKYVIQILEEVVLAESSQSNESSIVVKCNTCGSTVHSTSDHNEFDHFKRGEKIQAAKARKPTKNTRRNDVYVLDMSSLTLNGACFFAKALESVNWLWHKRLSHLNFKNINKLAKQNKVLGLPSLVYSKDKPCTACEKGKHHRASFKTKQNFSIRKCLHLLHMDLFGPVSPMFRNHKKYTLFIVDEYSRERIPDISYFHVFGCPVFIHNHKDHLGKFDAKADDGYFLGYPSVSKAFRVYNTRRQKIEETYHVTFDESMEAIRFTNTSVDEIGIDDSSRYPPDEFQEDDPPRQYQVDSDVSYYIIPHGCPPDLINNEGTHEQNIQNDQMIIQPTNVPSGNNTEVLGSITEPLVPDVTQSYITNQASTSMLTRSMATKLTTGLASECLFVDFLFEIEPKKLSEALKHPGWIDAMQEELNQFYRNKV